MVLGKRFTRKFIKEKLEQINFSFEDDKKKKFIIENLDITGTTKQTFLLYLSILNTLANFEHEVNLPLAKMPQDIVDDFFLNFNASTDTSLKSYLTILKTYLINTEENIDNINIGYIYIISLKSKDLKRFVNINLFEEKIITPQMIDDYVNSKKTYDSNTMCIVVLLWLGLTEKEIQELKKTSINITEEKVEIKVEDRIYETNYVDLFKKAISQTCYIGYDEKGHETYRRDFDEDCRFFICGGLSRKVKYANKISIKDIRVRLRDLGVSIGNKQLNYSNICISKKLYDMVKYFNFEKQVYTVYEKYKKDNNISIAMANISETTGAMLKKLEI